MNLRENIIIPAILSGMLISGLWGDYVLARPVSTNKTVRMRTSDGPELYTVWDKIPAENGLERYVATKKIDLVSKPHGLNVVKTIYPGYRIKGISCVVYTTPSKHAIEVTRKTRVLKAYGRYENQQDYVTLYPGEHLYLVMYIGEGYYYALYRSQLLSVPSCIENLDGYQNPWAKYIGEQTDKALGADFWMCYRTDDGTVGWSTGLYGVEPEWLYNSHRQYGR